MKNLSDVLPGQTVLIREFQGNPSVVSRLQDFGFTPGCEVLLFAKQPLGGAVAVALRGTKIALRCEDASCVLIQPLL